MTNFKEMILKESEETCNFALVVRKRQISSSAIYTLVNKKRQRVTTKKFPQSKEKPLKAPEKKSKEVNKGNTN